MQRTARKTLKKKETTLSDFKTYKLRIIKMVCYWNEDRYIGQRKGIKNLEIHTHVINLFLRKVLMQFNGINFNMFFK